MVPSTSYVPSRQKRSYEDDDEDDMDTQPQAQGHAHNGTTGRDGDALVETTISLSHSLTHSLTHTAFCPVSECTKHISFSYILEHPLSMRRWQERGCSDEPGNCYLVFSTNYSPPPFLGTPAAAEAQGNGDSKRQETEAPSGQKASSPPLDLNFPLPGEKGPACLVKVRLLGSLMRSL